ncbi:hypothetical protein Micbo1qcDRAFT_205824 [Microdochium bolleyi]|uniref:Uncharacterized protein n=1 Tax=Microdochium bolleyi TaxID=196109 RepID=A0A136IZM7_9PEZI|nr:hypothetical protein Micbo1qcDRAFT_205824 [Microdochium bolleyi]
MRTHTKILPLVSLLLLLACELDTTRAELSPPQVDYDIANDVNSDGLPSPMNTYRFAAMASNLNVFKQPLKLFSQQPMTGFFRDGYCRTTTDGPGSSTVAADPGNHAVAGIVTDEFLDFSASRGNDLRTVGLSGGCRWCLCTSRWLEAYQAFRAGRISEMGVPRVDLHATEDSALAKVDLEVFKRFEVKHEDVSPRGGN